MARRDKTPTSTTQAGGAVDIASAIAWVLDGAPPWRTRPTAFGELCQRLVAGARYW